MWLLLFSVVTTCEIENQPHNYFSNCEFGKNTVGVWLIFIRGINASHGYRCGFFMVYVLLKSEELIRYQVWRSILISQAYS